jgi:hypothetical protein
MLAVPGGSFPRPAFPDLEPGAKAEIKGKVIFFEGSPEAFSSALGRGDVKLPG